MNMDNTLQALAKKADGAIIVQTPENLLLDIGRIKDEEFTATDLDLESIKDDELWSQICEQLGIGEEETLDGKNIIYQPDFGFDEFEKSDRILKAQIIHRISIVRKRIAKLLLSKQVEDCLLIEQTWHAAFLSAKKYSETSSGWAVVEGHPEVVCKITPLNAERRDSDRFYYDQGALIHPKIVPEYHVFVDNQGMTLFVSFAPNCSGMKSFYQLYREVLGKVILDKDDVWKVMEAFEDILETHQYMHSKGLVHVDSTPTNALIHEKNDRFPAYTTDTMGMVKEGTDFRTRGASYTQAYSEQELYKYDEEVEKFSYATDDFALACTAIEFLSGKVLWKEVLPNLYGKLREMEDNKEREAKFFAFITKIITEKARVPEDIKPDLIALLQSMVQHERSERPQLDTVIPKFKALTQAVRAAAAKAETGEDPLITASSLKAAS